MSSERLARISEVAQGFVDRGEFAGVMTLVARNGRIVHFESAGQRGINDSAPVREDDLYRIFSMTKPIVAVAAMVLFEQGKFSLSDPVSRYIPELADRQVWTEEGLVAARHEPTMGELLTHTAGFGYGIFPGHPVEDLYRQTGVDRADDLADFVAKVADLPLRYQPGDRWHYSIASDLTGVVVERIAGQPLDVFFREQLFEPLGMVDTFFEVPEHKRARLVPNSIWDREAGEIRPVSADSPVPYSGARMFSGGAGLVSSIRDYLRFAEMLRRGGELDGVRVLSPKTVSLMMTDHLPRLLPLQESGRKPTLAALGSGYRNIGFGLGAAVTRSPAESGSTHVAGVYTWGGAAGTVFWVDPVEEIVAIAMVQQVLAPWPLRERFTALVNHAITESYVVTSER